MISTDENIIIICSKEYVIINKTGHVPELVELGIDVGQSVSEENMGTNCLGTCIISNVPIAVFGDQHF